MSYREELHRIERALEAARESLRDFTPGAVEVTRKAGGDPVTEADHAVNDTLLEMLPRPGEGWFSEETRDDGERLGKKRVWIVDPLDGTKEFILGLPEWSVSIGLVEDGRPVAGGILNPMADHLIVGGEGMGVHLNGKAAQPTQRTQLSGASVLASRSEIKRGEWDRFADCGFEILTMGSVAYKLGMVAAGLADATWTLVPKNEWDVAAGVALVFAGGGKALDIHGEARVFNQKDPLLQNHLAAGEALLPAIFELIGA